MTVKASIDIGTNSILVLAAEIIDGRLIPIYQDLAEPRLGKNLTQAGIISKKALLSAIEAIREFHSKAIELGAEEIILYGTEVFRSASNGEECANKIGQAVGEKMRILTPEEEARYAFIGAVSGLSISSNALVVDLGGGSMEMILGKERLENWTSLPIGAVSITERFSATPPLETTTTNRLLENISSEINPPFEIDSTNTNLVGVGGTITTLGAINLALREYSHEKVHGSKLKITHLREIFFELSKKTTPEIADMIPFSPARADIIFAGNAVFIALMEKFGFSEITISDHGSRWGILLEKTK
jgi:exopolyphosphatase/guanosine-5'-triphosphate,3'-diphosphate pyrophosphatase